MSKGTFLLVVKSLKVFFLNFISYATASTIFLGGKVQKYVSLIFLTLIYLN